MLFSGILWGFRGHATDRMAFCDTKCVSGENGASKSEAKYFKMAMKNVQNKLYIK